MKEQKKYIFHEEQRHKYHSFEDELISFLNLQEIDFNPKFLVNTTYTRLIYHLVWSVKNREPLLCTSLQNSIHQCIRNEVQGLGGQIYAIGNVADHILLLAEFTKKYFNLYIDAKFKNKNNSFD